MGKWRGPLAQADLKDTQSYPLDHRGNASPMLNTLPTRGSLRRVILSFVPAVNNENE